MNKLLIKDKTSFMELVLSFFILLILILGIVFFKVRISANNLDLEVARTSIKKAEYKIIIGLYFLGFIKIGAIKISNGVIQFLFFKVGVNKILSIVKPRLESIPRRKLINDFCKMKVKLENLNLDLKFGTDDVIITSILIAILSGIIATTMQEYIEKFNKEKYKWKILPDFEERLFLDLNASLKLSYSPILSRILKNE